MNSMDPAWIGRSFDTDLLIFRSLFAIDSNTNLPVSTQYILATDGIGGLQWQDAFTNLSTYSGLVKAGVGYLPSTIYSFSTQLNTLSSVNGTGLSSISTSIGLGGIPGSITGPQLYSTVAGLGKASYVSTATLNNTICSTVNGLGTAGYISAANLTATLSNVFDISTPITSTVVGLGTISYVSTPSLISSLDGLATYGYVSSLHLQSTVRGLGRAGYISTAALTSTFTGARISLLSNSASTVQGLGTLGYVSTQTLLSSTDGLMRNISVDRAGTLVVYNSHVTVSSLQNLAFLSTFYHSSITYKGNNGPQEFEAIAQDINFSSATINFGDYSNYITSTSLITIDVYPTFLFNEMSLICATTVFSFSTLLQYDHNPVPDIVNHSYLVGTGFLTGNSNFFNQPIRMTFTGCNIVGHYDQPYTLIHRMPGSLSYNLTGGIDNTTTSMAMYMASTNSLFISIQNPLIF